MHESNYGMVYVRLLASLRPCIVEIRADSVLYSRSLNRKLRVYSELSQDSLQLLLLLANAILESSLVTLAIVFYPYFLVLC